MRFGGGDVGHSGKAAATVHLEHVLKNNPGSRSILSVCRVVRVSGAWFWHIGPGPNIAELYNEPCIIQMGKTDLK